MLGRIGLPGLLVVLLVEQESKSERDEYQFMSLMEGQPAVETIWIHRNKVVASVYVRETFS